MNYYCEHNICPLVTDLPAKTDTVLVNRDIHFDQIAHVLHIDTEQLLELNPQYRRNVINGSSQPSALRLPAALINTFIDKADSIYAYNPDELLNKRTEVVVNDDVPMYTSPRKTYSRKSGRRTKETRRHGKKQRLQGKSITIKDGDTLSEIAARNHTTVKKLRKLNNISGSNIRAGKKIKVK